MAFPFGSFHAELARGEVYIRPFERHDLSAAQSRLGAEENDCVLVCACRVNKMLTLLDRARLDQLLAQVETAVKGPHFAEEVEGVTTLRSPRETRCSNARRQVVTANTKTVSSIKSVTSDVRLTVILTRGTATL